MCRLLLAPNWNKKTHKPNNFNKWCEVFQDFESANEKSWHRIFKLPFAVLRNTKIQTFQYKVLHRVILCNKWLYNIKIKDYEICEYCNKVDDIVHFFLKCSKVRDIWNVILNWLERLIEINLKNTPIFNECILFGYPNPSPKTKDKIHVINYCIFYIKYCIYIQKLFNKKHLDLHSCQMHLKHAIVLENEICNKNKTLVKLEKFNFICNNSTHYLKGSRTIILYSKK